MLLLPKRRKVVDGTRVKFLAQYDKVHYNCTLYVSSEEKLMVDVQIPEGFEKAAVDPVTFSDFEDLLLSYDKISSLELFLKKLKFINFEGVFLAESPRIELTLLKMVNGSFVLHRKMLEKEGNLVEYVKPTEYVIMVVRRDKSWEAYDEERNFQVSCEAGDSGDAEIICEADAYKSVASRIESFRMVAGIIYLQNF